MKLLQQIQTNREEIDIQDLIQLTVNAIQSKKGFDILVVNLKNTPNAIVDYLVICSADSDIQMNAIYQSIEEKIHSETKMSPWGREGKDSKEWMIMDYVDLVIHIFNKNKRHFYSLEHLWGDAIITQIDNVN